MLIKKPVLAYCISGHGFGHGVRAVSLFPYLAPYFEIHLITSLPEQFFKEEGMGACVLHKLDFDSACVQKNSIQVDIPATLHRARLMLQARSALLEELVKIYKQIDASLVLSDVGALPLAAAYQLTLPGLLMGNFTWADIYSDYEKEYPDFTPILEALQADYARASGYFFLTPGLTEYMPPPPNLKYVGMLARQGKNKKSEFAQRYGMDGDKKWCLVYLGNYGLDHIHGENLELLTDWEFFGVYPFPGNPKNYFLIDKEQNLFYPDLTASSDVILGKLGYGLLAECMYIGKPVIYFERFNFCEQAMLETVVTDLQMGVKVDWTCLEKMHLSEVLGQALTLHPKSHPALAGKIIAQELLQALSRE